MPPSRRRPPPSSGATPPVRRPRVAGTRNRPATAPDEAPDTPENAPERESVSGTLDIEETPRVQRSRRASPTLPSGESNAPDTDEPDEAEPAWTEPVSEIDLGADPEPESDPEDADEDEPAKPAKHAAPPRGQRPAGKRRSAGTTRPADLTAAEAEAGAAGVVRRVRAAPRRKANLFGVAAVLVVVAVVLAGLAVWFRGQADALDSGDSNTALTDSATTSEVTGKLTSAIEDTFSYNYTDLASTQKAVDNVLTGKARCEYDQLFDQVKKLAPEQKIIIATAVRDIALVRLDGDRAEALVFIDQSSTRVDVNNSVAGEAQFGVLAHRDGDTWKITDFNMFDQKLVNDQPAPSC